MALTKVKLIADGVIVQSNLDASHGITTADIGENASYLYYTDGRVSSYLSSNGYATQTDIVAAITDSAPATLDTLNELAAALGDDANFSTTVTNSIATKMPLAGGTFTGAVVGTSFSAPSGFINGSNGGIRIHSSGTKFFNITAANAARDNIMDIGASDARFKDLYLGGNIQTAGNVTFGDSHFIGDDADDNLLIQSSANENIIINSVDDLLLRTGGTTKLIVKNGGNVGIGTTSPGYTFHVGKSITNDWIAIINNTYDGAGNGLLIDAGNGTSGEILRLRDRNGNSKVSFLSNGNVGIGTTSPQRKLDVSGTALIASNGNVNKGTLALGVQDSGSTKWSVITGAHYNAASGSGNGSGSAGIMMIGTLAQNGENDVVIGGNVYETNAATSIQFWTHTTDTSTAGGTRRMIITSNGNVGMGSTSFSPATGLHLYYQNSADMGSVLTLGNNGCCVSNRTGVGFKDGSYYRSGIVFETSGTDGYAGHIIFKKSSNSTTLDGTTETMRIHSNGNVGIGTADPDHKLEVVGGIALRNSNSRLYFGTNNGTDRRALEGNVDGTLLQIGEGYSKTALYGSVGIATTSPQANLDVNEDLRVNRYHKNIFKFHNTTSASNQYFHIKTGVGTNQVCMHMYHVEGYAYGQSALLDERFGFHTDSGGGIYGKSYKGSFANNIYESSDNKVVLVFGPINTYYMSFMVHLIESGMYTELFVKPSAATYSSSNSGAY